MADPFLLTHAPHSVPFHIRLLSHNEDKQNEVEEMVGSSAYTGKKKERKITNKTSLSSHITCELIVALQKFWGPLYA